MVLFLLGGGIFTHKAAYAGAGPGMSVVDAPNGRLCQGIVKDEAGKTVIGASVTVSGTTLGVTTGIDGKFELRGVKKGDILRISFIGYETVEVVYNGQFTEITLKQDTKQLEEVVVTALGIKREKKAVGYAVQEVKGEELLAARENNLANALTGKVAGVQITRSSNGPAGSSKIQLRGSNSLTGTNQPLIVVDGIPLENFTGADNNDFWNPATDMGNGLSDINAEDIESMSVLKGASAAALYGSRAGNGVILITTKKGRKNQGLGLNVSFNLSLESVFMKPDRQTAFGQGSDGLFKADEGSNWGPAIKGQTYTDWNGREQQMKFYDNAGNFFDTGVSTTENVSFSQQFNKTAVYISATYMSDASKIPHSDYRRANLMTRISSTFGRKDRWAVDAKLQYINSRAKNRPINGQRNENYFYTMYMMPNTIDIREFKQTVDPGTGRMYWWDKGGLNPYWQSENNLNQDIRNRLLMNYSLKYCFTGWLNLELKAGSDMYFTETQSQLASGSPLSETGRFSFGEDKFYENNFSFLLTMQQDDVLGRFGGHITFGGNLMERKSAGLSASAGKLIVPDLFWISNAEKSEIDAGQRYSHRKTNSLYGTAGINYDGWAFLEATFRNDWSSTLSKANRSFFYPSVSASWVVSDMIDKIGGGMPNWFSFAKVRGSYAEVGNDLGPYQLYNTYGVSSIWGTGAPSSSMDNILYNEEVRSELIGSWEVGAELHFFNNHLGFDFTWYKSNARRQLISIPMNSLSGYSGRMINAGNIQNKGMEFMVNATLFATKDFRWDSQFNFSTNRNEIISLADDVTELKLGGYDNLSIIAKAGGNYGEIWGTTFKRVEDPGSPYDGALILNELGLPTSNSDPKKLGDQQADGLLGWSNTFFYKGLTLGITIDGRIGGEIFSGTNRMLQAGGVAAVTAPDGKREDMLVSGVTVNEDGSYAPNAAKVSPQQYWKTISTASGNLGIGEANIYDATNIRLRNVSLNYTFPKSLIRKTPFQSVKVGFSCNNVWMIKSYLRGIDPESVYATNTNATGFENASSPTSRSFMFNVSFGF